MTNFNNPIPVSPNALTDMLSMSAFAGTETEDQTPIDNGLNLEEEKPLIEETETKPIGKEGEGEKEEGKEGLDIQLSGSELPSLGEEKTDTKPQTINYETVIDTLAERGIIQEAYEGFGNDEINEETLTKLLEHNIEKVIEERFDGFIGELSDYTKRLIDFDVNAKGKGVEQYLQTLIEEQSIKNLDVTNEYDQEKIVRQWYSRKEGYSQSELEEKITELKDAGLLEKESKRIKPKLDDEAVNIAKAKEEEQRQLRETENKVKEVYNKRVIDTLKTGKIGGITLSKEDAGNIYSVLTGDETIEMNLPNGQKAMMTPLDAHIFFNKYAKEGSLERLALATLLLTNPAKFEKEYSKKIETKVTNTFVQEHKYNNAVKGGKVDTREEPKNQSFTEKNKNAKWPLKVK